METAEAIQKVNGVDVSVLGETVAAIQSDPELGHSKFRVSNVWNSGNQNTNSISGFYGARQELSHKQTFSISADEPPILAGSDEAPNPVEIMLSSLASCLTTSLVAHAAVRGIEIRSLESEVEGDLDLNGFLGLDPSAPKGFTDIRVNFRIEADSDDVHLLKRLALFSPVFHTITAGARVHVGVANK
jgi:uncharacterized OsmC-like protein